MKPLSVEFLYQRHVDIAFRIFFQDLGIFLANFLDRQFEIFSRRIGLQGKSYSRKFSSKHFAVLDFHVL
jgi:uncharacterized metal-binding protein